MSDSVRPHRRQPTMLPRPWDSPGKSTGVGCHCLLRTVALISHNSKVMLKILQAKIQHYVNSEFKMLKLVSEKAEEPGSNCQHPLDHQKSKRVPEKKKKSISALLTMPKPLTVWITINCGKF